MPQLWNRALVTGASAGIGEAFARRLAADGTPLVLVARRADRLEAIAGELRDAHDVEVEVLAADLADEAELGKVVQRLQEDARPIDLLVNNAGYGRLGRFHDLDADDMDQMVRLNVNALVTLSHAAIPNMKARGRGGILNVASMVALMPIPHMAVYGATKAFVLSFSEALHEELRRYGIHVTCLNPGFTKTEFQEVADVDTSIVPSLAMMGPEPVVKSGLDAIGKNRAVVAPGYNAVGQAASRFVPSAVLRKAMAVANERR